MKKTEQNNPNELDEDLGSHLIDGVRKLLRQHEALLVHFNTPMTDHPVGYPKDLHDALENPQWEMCHSTILSTDLGPTQTYPAEAAACGSVGIIVDLEPASSIISVHHGDGGSNGRIRSPGMGSTASIESCENSILNRFAGHNEWYLSGARAVGIFCFVPPMVYLRGLGEAEYHHLSVANDFPDERIFSAHKGKFLELERDNTQWAARSYGEIVPA
ncbi:hypothetical protein JQV19_06100 [Sulfitobacter mediterraneus]|uniref:hypothetical protein n=1 Tax=Sulfitobacter mediterraneus TaxID=83219 RepID=UPI001939B856|nr:hypothetical protein [Sulfitobacter mediterraneus]MBM1556220.1 hypothetical protein [Sulfitobacter mediterraneus]MBM1567742.1 hypothetical protein [Sulfitobacter mediterraneus]MBM1571574.1 hypothetical protein [Sulfitobacter mediterraneus]MBM1575362.1 hypothetical protein [Sulfitobacter mediterraneus]MBM1579147.1 hypothetical protein [Sulfitobacter mediterraneus]